MIADVMQVWDGGPLVGGGGGGGEAGLKLFEVQSYTALKTLRCSRCPAFIYAVHVTYVEALRQQWHQTLALHGTMQRKL